MNIDWFEVKGHVKVALYVIIGMTLVILPFYFFPKATTLIIMIPAGILVVFFNISVALDDHRRWVEFKKKNGYDKWEK